MHRVALVIVAAVAVVVMPAAAAAPSELPLSTPGSTSAIQFVSSSTVDGWKYDAFRNGSYPCAVSGYQTFVIGTKVGSSATSARPLFVHMHGGGAGYFDAAGHPIPSAGQKVEESAASLTTRATNKALLGKVRADAAGFRTLTVSYCSHDVYGGVNTPDPNNPNTTPEGNPRTTNGILATKAAIQFAAGIYPTTKTFLHGGSAGSAGTFGVSWSMQQQGLAPAGIIADASIANLEALSAAYEAGICTDDFDPSRIAAIAARVHPDLANIENEPDKLVSDGRLTVPILHVWNHGDVNTCGAQPLSCPLRDGSTATLGVTDCIHEPMLLAIAAQGQTSRSMNMPLCVDYNDDVPDCSTHVVTNKTGVLNTDPASPADYLTAIMDWVHTRLTDVVAVVPGVPTIGTVTLSGATASVPFAAPASNGGSAITSYTATCTSSNGGTTRAASRAASPVSVSTLTPGKRYTCQVAATNVAGTGASSAASNAVTVANLPGAPTGVKAVSGSTTVATGSLTVTFTAPASNGGSAITRYTATCTSSNGGVAKSAVHIGATAAPITVAAVTTGKTYTCTVRATNAVGTGAASTASLAVIAGSPAAPTAVTAVKVAAGQLRVSFTAGANNGAVVTSYTATCTSSNGGVTGARTGTASPLTVTSLTTSKSYTCRVKATNARGAGLASAPSAPVTA